MTDLVKPIKKIYFEKKGIYKVLNMNGQLTVRKGGHAISLMCSTADVMSSNPTSNNSISSNSVRDKAS